VERACRLMLKFIVLLCLCWNIGIACAKEKISIVFRYDDYSSVSPTGLEKDILTMFRKHGMPILLAVIPFTRGNHKVVPLSDVKARMLVDAVQGHVAQVALHGFVHQDVHRHLPHSEFMGVDYETQLHKITVGKRLLEGVIGQRIRIFVPPWNTYDQNTVLALEKSGFSVLSGDLQGKLIDGSSLRFVPETTNLVDLEGAIDDAWHTAQPFSVIVVVFHPIDFVGVGKGLQRYSISENELNALLEWLSRQHDIRVMSMMDVVSRMENGRIRPVFISNERTTRLLEFLPPKLRISVLKPESWMGTYGVILLRVVTLYLSVCLLGCYLFLMMARWIVRRYSRRACYVFFGVSCVWPVLALAYLLVDDYVGYVGCMASTVLLAGFLGFQFGLWHQRPCLKT